ncbi:hypothetical protein LTR72_004896 [Exophiala xenobiotica]|nr:hypothetical protein LTR72_004896 [Exophiala xenobiotica]KAK5337886.1 hypothetical protein LTR98_005735 [Exophiala xenobiotica]KAK5418390.1 hypothetical protein LTR06_002140 [Exophiala xenobiotica]KAK5559962.1 hypothetical protein LTR46_001712 [Exophiala xenobiotica]
MAQPHLTEVGVQENLDRLYQAVTGLFETNLVNVREHLNTRVAQTLSEIHSLKRDIEEGRSSLQSHIDSLADAIKNHSNDVESTSYGENERSKHSVAEYTVLEERCSTFQNENERLTAENEHLTQQLEAEQQSVRNLERTQQLWKAKLSRLQAVITKDATNANEIIDSEVTAKVQHIRARTETIVKKYCVGSRARPAREHKEMEEFDQDWLRKRKQIPARYEDSDKRIFSQPCFGLDKDLESKLGEFETLISKYAYGKDTSDWRALTLRYCKVLSLKNDDTPKKAGMYIARLFDPWVIGRDENIINPKADTYRYRHPPQLISDLTDLCREAYDLTVVIRQSTDRYQFISIDEDSKFNSADETNFQPDDMLGPKDKIVGSKVWLTVFGALVKETQTGDRYVVEKARVICRAAPPLSDQAKD